MTDKDYKDEDFEDLEDDEDLEEDSLDDESEEEVEENKEEVETTKETKPKQSQQQNEFYKNLRLKNKEEADIRADERKKVLLDSVNHVNPYTEKPIVDEEDEEEFFIMREMESKGKNPVEDYSDYIKERKREAKRTQERTFDTKTDLMDFKESYPNVDVKGLMDDKDFIDMFGEELGKVSLKTLYKAYEKTQSKVKKVKNDDIVAKRKKSNPGAQSSRNELSLKDVPNMRYDSEDFEKLLEKARRGELVSE